MIVFKITKLSSINYLNSQILVLLVFVERVSDEVCRPAGTLDDNHRRVFFDRFWRRLQGFFASLQNQEHYLTAAYIVTLTSFIL